MQVPPEAPGACPVCDSAYDSISEHDAGVMENLLDNERYRRVCFQPKSGGRLWFYHHTHEQTAVARPDASEESGVSADASENAGVSADASEGSE